MGVPPFADRLAALVTERRSQICLGLDPDPARSGTESEGAVTGDGGGASASRAARAARDRCLELIERAGPACVAAKLQMACFERLGAPGWGALAEVRAAAAESGLLVIADGKRGDIPVTAEAYGQAMVGAFPTPWGQVEGLGVDAFTVNPLAGRDSMAPLVEAARRSGAGVFTLVRTSNPGAADIQDLVAGGRSVHEHLADMVDYFAGELLGDCGLSGSGGVVGATSPDHLPRLRELMPRSILLLPGVGAQGGDPSRLSAAFEPGRAAALVSASRSIDGDRDPRDAAERLRGSVWEASAR